MAGFIGKIIQWFANEHLVKLLANNRTFQQAAVKIDSFLTVNKDVARRSGEEMFKKGSEVLKEQSSRVQEVTTAKSGFDFVKFGTAFKEEVMKDIGKINRK